MSNVAVNQKAPNFEIQDFNGNMINISNFVGNKNVLIVLNRGFA